MSVPGEVGHRRKASGCRRSAPAATGNRREACIGFALVCAVAGAFVAPPASGAESVTVGIVLTGHKAYREVATEVEKELKKAGHSCLRIELPRKARKPTRTPASGKAADRKDPSNGGGGFKKLVSADPAVIVSVGLTATSATLENVPDKPVIFAMVANALDTPLLAKEHPHRSRLAGVAAHISPADQVAWIAELHPKAKKVAVFHSTRSKRTTEAIRSAADAKGITIVPIETRMDRFGKAIEELGGKGCDGVLMIPDARVYNSTNVRRLLLWGIRQRKPVWAFSGNIVKAGALAGKYSSTEEAARQTVKLVKKVVSGEQVAGLGLQYPRGVQTSFNERTAEMIGLSISHALLKKATARYGKKK